LEIKIFKSINGEIMVYSNVVQYESVNRAVEILQNSNRAVTARAVRELLGSGSFATILPLIRQVLSSKIVVPPETEERFRPVLSAIAEASRSAVLEASENLKADNTRLEKDLDDATNEISDLEAYKKEADDEINKLKTELTMLIGAKESIDDQLKALHILYEILLRENEKFKIIESNYNEIKDKYNTTLEKSLLLEGRLLELEDLIELKRVNK
jgi:septal ring factor EnvC (AmiA/AmiB activator)